MKNKIKCHDVSLHCLYFFFPGVKIEGQPIILVKSPKSKLFHNLDSVDSLSSEVDVKISCETVVTQDNGDIKQVNCKNTSTSSDSNDIQNSTPINTADKQNHLNGNQSNGAENHVSVMDDTEKQILSSGDISNNVMNDTEKQILSSGDISNNVMNDTEKQILSSGDILNNDMNIPCEKNSENINIVRADTSASEDTHPVVNDSVKKENVKVELEKHSIHKETNITASSENIGEESHPSSTTDNISDHSLVGGSSTFPKEKKRKPPNILVYCGIKDTARKFNQVNLSLVYSQTKECIDFRSYFENFIIALNK